MAIWGKILGGTAGLMMGGPLGALLGGLAGHAYDRLKGEPGDENEPSLAKQTTFAIGVIVLSAKMAKADGTVTRDEVDAFKQIFHIPPDEIKNVGRVFDQARKDSRGFEPYAKQIARLFRENPAVLEELLGGLFHIATADGVSHPDEIDFLKKCSDIFGFDEATFQRMRVAHMGAAMDDPYTILGVNRDMSDKEIQKAWRDLVREHHPDTLVAQGMPEDFIEVATEKIATINAAYDEIAKQRGMT
ncbi:MAG: molecular chaperone DjlA [Rhodospirillaceae bacterium]|nr:molecular chaperone DjlA [Rhodospirillaceae bacterium]|tara:strand:+ start:68087 stop:68821 length:735 start_codon:yes stop_codon:yes gene_type:complete